MSQRKSAKRWMVFSSPQMNMHLFLQEHHSVPTLGKTSSKFDSTLPVYHSQKWTPTVFENLCRDAGAQNLYNCINDAICSDRMSTERKHLSKLPTMVVIYIMIYSQSQRSNAFQVALLRTLKQFGITEQGLQSLRNLGIAAHPHTVQAKAKSSSASHSSTVASFIESAVENEQFLIFCIDDYHNIHTMHRPETKKQTNAIHMSTLLVKVFPNIKAVHQEKVDLLPKSPVEISKGKSFISTNMHKISKTYSENMPDWVVAKYCSPESERQRLVTHDYQQTELNEMRCMDNTKLVDSIEMSLKSCEDVLTAVNKMLSGGLQLYLDHFITPFIGDWQCNSIFEDWSTPKLHSCLQLSRMLLLLLVPYIFLWMQENVYCLYFMKYLLIYTHSYLGKRQS